LDDYCKEYYRDELSQISFLPFYQEDKKDDYINYKLQFPYEAWVDIITYVNIGLNNGFYQDIHKIEDQNRLTVLVNKYNTLSDDYIPADLEKINPLYNPYGLMLRHDARVAFEEMCNAALEEGIHLQAVSTFRSFYYQWKVYLMNITPYMTLEEYQPTRDRISARPGHSEHQTGLSVDINELEQTFADTLEGKWLAANGNRFGFILRYPKGKEKITGYDYEPWHYRYIGKDLADAVTESYLTYDEFYIRYL
jgi:D-alanyl-D-alanine carboxypeptidase